MYSLGRIRSTELRSSGLKALFEGYSYSQAALRFEPATFCSVADPQLKEHSETTTAFSIKDAYTFWLVNLRYLNWDSLMFVDEVEV